jgi:hypothetical protein
MVFNATFNNISVVLLEKTTNLQQVTDKLYQNICNVVSSTPSLSVI